VIDLQVNGASCISFGDAPSVAEYRRAAAELARHQVDGFLATIPSSGDYERILEAASKAMNEGVPGLVGVHLEGPFLSTRRRGAHAAELLRPPDPTWLARLLDGFPGSVRLLTLAPELPGAGEVVAVCRERDVAVSAGHSCASPEEVSAIRPDMVTHLFNGMEPFHHRLPGLAGWALSDPTVTCGLIADGVHVSPLVLRIVFAAKGGDRIALVSDAVAHPESAHPEGAHLTNAARIQDGAWRLADGTIAGGAAYLDRGMEVCLAARIPRDQVIAAASSTPARLLGMAP
jgi:N-acetylglucosamine-6-phosphate deacetylase